MSKTKRSWLRITIIAVLALFCISCLLGFAACSGSDDSYQEGYDAGYAAGLEEAGNEGGGSGTYQEGYDAGYAAGVADAGSESTIPGAESLGTYITAQGQASNGQGAGYYTGFSSEEAAEEAAEAMNVQLAEESITLLKNQSSALPLSSGAKVSVLGIAQDCLVETSGNITSSLKAAGFSVNPTLENKYLNDSYSSDSVSGSLLATAPYGTEDELTTAEKSSISSYNDAVIVVLARGTAGESSDRSTNTGEVEDDEYLGSESGWTHEAQDTDGTTSYKHELELTASEQQLLADAEDAAGSGKVIVLYSSSNTFEMANLEDDENVDAILWMGRMGDGGIKAVGEILSGKVNPSGKTVDEWTRDFTNDPTYANKIVTAYNDEDGNSLRVTMGSDFMDNMYEAMMPGSLDLGSVDYEEDIYLGYKWYETYWAEASAGNATPTINGASASWNNKTGADAWYDYNVVYPYGYGLSYTDFSYELTSLETDTNVDLLTTASLSASDIFNSTNKENGARTITASVTVKNTGEVAGKETVEIYVEAPYGEDDSVCEDRQGIRGTELCVDSEARP